MIGLLTVTEAALYVCFAILIGGLFLYSLPERTRPAYTLPTCLLTGSSLLIALLSFVPLIPILDFLAEQSGQPFSIFRYLLSSDMGIQWLTLGLAAILLAVFIQLIDVKASRGAAATAFVWSLLLSVLIAWTSHASSVDAIGGFIAHWIHFAAVCLWFGILLIVSWFSTSESRWNTFMNWYSPLAIGCMTAITAAGLILMEYITPTYWDSWLLPYGQALLLKHLLYAVLISLAFINGFLLRKKMHLKWLRAETIVVVIILLVTAFMTHSASPRDVAQVLQTDGVSQWFELLHQGGWSINWRVDLAFNSYTLILSFMAILFAALMVMAYRKKQSPFVFIAIGCLAVITVFIAVLISIVPAIV
ncbi:copper resistance D family protein [Paenibacillus arenosi]|uniref:CopD family protein n=1 Tax=Paenibacillus arenosi TaxID=2774142 RepID=A0ABR9AZR7_9BACL|nr:CopD family protein [Paenibacillus arenosi]MBD8499630.1 CopD family protein [Paenibacillus arenosi]